MEHRRINIVRKKSFSNEKIAENPSAQKKNSNDRNDTNNMIAYMRQECARFVQITTEKRKKRDNENM